MTQHRRNEKWIIPCLWTLWFCVGLIPFRHATADTGKPTSPNIPLNILLILTDDQGMHMSCIGTRGIHTPHMDALARKGVLFEKAYATCASCSPSRSSILTGMYPHSNGHWRNTITPVMTDPPEAFGRNAKRVDQVGIHEDLPTLIEILNEKGYVTGITEKFHLSPPWKYPFLIRKACGSHPKSHASAVRSFLKDCADKPFFLMANVGNTHRPFSRHTFPTPAGPVNPAAIDVPTNLVDTPTMRKDLAEYLNTVQCADSVIGAILETLYKSGRADNTLVIFTSDQGYAYHRAKATVYNAGVHVPLIITGPAVSKNRITRELVSHIDLTPTILDYASIETPDTVQGESLRPLLENRKNAHGHPLIFSEHNAHGPSEIYPSRAVTDGRMRYIRNLTPEKRYQPPADLYERKPWDNHSYEATIQAQKLFPVQYELLNRTYRRPAEELYDLHTDPGEIHNLMKDERYADQRETLRKAMNRWMRETQDPGDPLKIVRRQ